MDVQGMSREQAVEALERVLAAAADWERVGEGQSVGIVARGFAEEVRAAVRGHR